MFMLHIIHGDTASPFKLISSKDMVEDENSNILLEGLTVFNREFHAMNRHTLPSLNQCAENSLYRMPQKGILKVLNGLAFLPNLPSAGA
jgi:hypothetical protein